MRVLACVLLMCSTLVACGSSYAEEEVMCRMETLGTGDTVYLRSCAGYDPPPGYESDGWITACGGVSLACSTSSGGGRVELVSPEQPECNSEGTQVTCADGSQPVCVYVPPIDELDPCPSE